MEQLANEQIKIEARIALTFSGVKGSTVFRNLCTLVLKDLLEFFADTLKLEMIDLLIQYPSIRWYKKN